MSRDGWRRQDEYTVARDAYTVAAYRVADCWWFLAWHGRERISERFETVDAAIAVANEHAHGGGARDDTGRDIPHAQEA